MTTTTANPYTRTERPQRWERAAISDNARVVLERRYLRKDQEGNLLETAEEMFRRVARNLAQAEPVWGGSPETPRLWEDRFYALMASLDFLPNSPTLMNAGAELQQLSACFVLPVGDSLGEIFDAVKYTALIHQSGGGTGFSFSRLRPTGDFVRTTTGVASGPVSFMRVFDRGTDVIKQGGKRRGANMGILRVDHPDILEFIHCKDSGTDITNFNISVGVTEEFMRAVVENRDYALINPRTGKEVVESPGRPGRLEARRVFREMAESAWRTGDPGCIFLDSINRSTSNPTPRLGQIEATNPCGEEPLFPYESCNLGSINLARFVRTGPFTAEHAETALRQAQGERMNGSSAPSASSAVKQAAGIDWERLRVAVWDAVRLLDNVIEMNRYPLPQIEEISKRMRRIGLGVMGFADMLYLLRVPYDSEEGLRLAEEVMGFVRSEADNASEALAEERGVFPEWQGSIYDPEGPTIAGVAKRRLRNCNRTVIAPTGTISIIADCSSGCEPTFALAFTRQHFLDPKDPNVMTKLTEVNEQFLAGAKAEGFYSSELMDGLAEGGHLADRDDVPEWAKRAFVVAHDIGPEWHVRMQAAFQHNTDNAVSKTINFPFEATVDEIERSYFMAWEMGCKGITIYRDRSRETQVLSLGFARAAAGEGEQPFAPTAAGVVEAARWMPGHEAKKPRPAVVEGYTRQIQAPEGKLNITINSDPEGPLEVFINVGKAGSDIAALAEALGRLISLVLRLPSPIPPLEKMEEVASQLRNIGGSRSVGFGPAQVRSLPDAVARTLEAHLAEAQSPQQPLPGLGVSAGIAEGRPGIALSNHNLCPDCGRATLAYEEGCVKCHACGYSEC